MERSELYRRTKKKNTRHFVITHDESKLGTRGHNHKNGTTLCRELKAPREKMILGHK